MQLSKNARKAVAIGLTLSTFVWSAVLVAVPAVSSAAVRSDGCLVLSGGAVWKIENGTRRGFTSAEVFASQGYNFSQVVTASVEDAALPVGPIIVYADGSLVKGPSDPLVYLVANGQKRGFVSGSVFTGLGFSFANIVQAPANTFNDLPMGANMDSTTAAHTSGVLVNSSGTIYQMTATGKKGVPSMAVLNSLGLLLSKAVVANSADIAAVSEGVLAERVVCSSAPVVSGSVTVSLSGPAASTLINDQSQANLANFVFSGSGTVTAVSLKRVGISADTALTNVYLFDGGTRLTDSASVSSGSVINFTNSNGLFTISGSRTISVKADMNGTAGETIAVQLTAITLSSGSVGGLPVTGNYFSIATASLADVNMASATGSGNTDPGEKIVIFQGNASVTSREVSLNRLSLRQMGTIVSTDIKNFNLYVDGVLAASQSALDANGYVTFNMVKTLATGTRVLKVEADVIGGSGRTVQMSLRGAYDITVVDTQYNASPVVTATGSFPFGPSAFTVNAGTVTLLKASDSASTNVTVGASDVPLGKWTATAYGESVKIETLTVAVDTTGGTTSEHRLRNGRVLIGGAQYGSTTSVQAVDVFASGQSFTVNYTVAPGTPVSVEFRADMYDNLNTDNIGAGTVTAIQVAMFGSSTLNNAIPQVSLGTLDVPASTQNANSLTVATGTISLTQLASYPAQTTAVPQSSYKLGQWTLTGNSAEAVNINTFAVGFASAVDAWDASDDLSNVFIKYGSSTTAIKGSISDGSITSLANSWSQSFTLAVNQSMNIELWATIASSATNGDATADTMTSYLRVTGITALSGTTVYADVNSNTDGTDNGNTSQVITAGSGTLTATKDASSADAKLVDDSGTVTSVAWKFAAVTDSFAITDLSFSLGDATAVSSVTLKDGSTVIATKPAAASMSFSGLEVPVSADSNKVITVELTMAMVGVGGGTSDVALTTTMVAFTSRNSSGTTDASDNDTGQSRENNPAGSAMYAYKAVPLLSVVALPNADLAAGAGKVIAKFTVSSNGTGTVAWKQAMFEISKTATPTIASVALYNADTGEAITSAKVFQNGTTGLATTCVADNVFCELLISVGTNADDDVVEQISGAKTYEVRATIGGAIAVTDSVAVTLDRNTVSHVAKAIYTTARNSLAAGNVSFTWSDESNAATSDTGVATWLPDFLVKNLPLNWSLN